MAGVIEQGSFSPDNLIGGDKKLVTEEILVAAGQNLSRGSVLGRVKVSVPSTGTADSNNTGDGTCTAVSGGSATKVGTYTIACIRAVTNGGDFEITDPNGNFVGRVQITAGAGGTGVFKSEELNFTITDDNPDFAIGDKFTVEVTNGVPSTGTADSGNTGNGTVTNVEGRRHLKIGDYTIECTASATDSGTFKVTDPDGKDIQTGIVIPVDDGYIDFENDQIAGTVTVGATDFAVGDKFTVTVSIHPRQVKLLDKTATDGSSEPYAVLSEDLDASTSAVFGIGYIEGQFNERQLVFANGTDIEDVRDKMIAKGMVPVASVKQ